MARDGDAFDPLPFRVRNLSCSNQVFNWTPDCQEVSLRIWARAPGGSERELLPRREWNGPLALPQFLRQAQPLGRGRLQWRLRYADAELVVEYRLRSGSGILAIAHRSPPGSMRE